MDRVSGSLAADGPLFSSEHGSWGESIPEWVENENRTTDEIQNVDYFPKLLHFRNSLCCRKRRVPDAIWTRPGCEFLRCPILISFETQIDQKNFRWMILRQMVQEILDLKNKMGKNFYRFANEPLKKPASRPPYFISMTVKKEMLACNAWSSPPWICLHFLHSESRLKSQMKTEEKISRWRHFYFYYRLELEQIRKQYIKPQPKK
uniref:Uncharacterized protein n=1 Tax=Romanomermis culicivorax TaxID=13658 RepID=A0A915LBG2_ROMCU